MDPFKDIHSWQDFQSWIDSILISNLPDCPKIHDDCLRFTSEIFYLYKKEMDENGFPDSQKFEEIFKSISKNTDLYQNRLHEI